MPKAYAAFLRGISPTNASMPALRDALERAGLENVKTIIASGNASFVTSTRSEARVQREVDAAIAGALGREVLTILRTIDELQALLDADPFAPLALPSGAKRIVTFLPSVPTAKLELPIELGGACIHAVRGREVLTWYVPTPGQPIFMTLIEKTFGKDITTRTWDTVKKVVASQAPPRGAKRRARPG